MMLDLLPLQGVFAGGMLLTAFFSVGRKRLPVFVRHYALSSLCLAGIIGANAVGSRHLAEYTGTIATIVVKVVVIPLLLLATARRCGESFRLQPLTRPVASYALATLAIFGAWLLSRRLTVALGPVRLRGDAVPLWGLLFVALALILLGFLILIIRRDLYSQIVGFLTLENGISAFAVIAIGGAPFLMEMGIFAVIGTGVVLMAILSQQVHAIYRSHDTASLTDLVD